MPAATHELILVDGHSVNDTVRVTPELTAVRSFEHRYINRVSNLNSLRDGLRVLRTIAYERRTVRYPAAPFNMRSQVPHRMWPSRIRAMNPA